MIRLPIVERRTEAQCGWSHIGAGGACRRAGRRHDAEVVNRRLAHALQQVLDHVRGAPGGGGAFQVSELFLLGHHERGDQLTDRPGECRHQGCLQVQAGALVADHRDALAELLAERRAANGAEQVFGADWFS